MRAKKILVLLGHPDTSGLCGAIADAYAEAAKSAGHFVRRLNVAEMQFDYVLHKGYRKIQPLEPDLLRFQELVRTCDHLVVIYPNWWSGPPSILKGLFERAWLPGFAYKYIKTKSGKPTIFWKRLLKGKTARVIVTAGEHPYLMRLIYGHFTQQISIATLWFAGFRVRETVFGPADNPAPLAQKGWLDKVRQLGKEGV